MLYDLLVSKGKLFANVAPVSHGAPHPFDAPACQPPVTPYSAVINLAPEKVVGKIAERQSVEQVEGFSAAIGHNLTYTFGTV